MTNRRLVAVAAWGLATVLVGAGGFWAGRVTTEVPSIAVPPTTVETVTVQDGSLGRSIEVTVLAQWSLTDVASAAVSGTVTTVADITGGPVEVGTTLLTIGLRPMVLAQGAVPAFRDLEEGAVGQDVAQLHTFLASQGFLASGLSGSFTATTTKAVKAWQKSLGIEQTGVVLRGDLIFVANVPAQLRLDLGIVVGALIEPGTVVLNAISAAPDLWIATDPNQTSTFRSDAKFVVTAGGLAWDAVVNRTVNDPETGGVRLILTAADGSALCGAECAQAIPVEEANSAVPLAGQAIIVPEVSGPMVPQSALATSALGDNLLVDSAGARIPVTVLVAADGQAIVDGVASGDTIRLFGSDG